VAGPEHVLDLPANPVQVPTHAGAGGQPGGVRNRIRVGFGGIGVCTTTEAAPSGGNARRGTWGRCGGVTEVRRDPRGVELMRLCRVQHRFGLYLIALDDQLDGGQPAPRSSPG
jgi:hypothetical protein